MVMRVGLLEGISGLIRRERGVYGHVRFILPCVTHSYVMIAEEG